MSSSLISKPSLTTSFKCLITFNQKKYKIVVENDLNSIAFNHVLNEMRKQINTKQNISHETHNFEIFDNDFNEYVMISSDEVMIESMSRIRVLPKHKNKWIQTESQYLNTSNDNNSCDTNGSKASKPSNAVAVTPLKPMMAFTPQTVSSLQSMNTSNSIMTSIATNSLPNVTNIKNTVITNSTINTITPCLSPESDHKFKCRALLTQFVHKFHKYFEANHENQTNGWQMVSNEMIKNGFTEYTGMVCKTEFNTLFSIYVETLRMAIDYKSACTQYQLFAKLNAMDLKFFMNPSTYRKVVELKKLKFNMDSDSNNSLNKTQVSSEPLVQNYSTINTITQTDSKFKCQSILAQLVLRFHKYFEANQQNPNEVWQMVSNEMIKKGLKDYTGIVCKKEFNNLNSVYVQTLRMANNYKSACDKYQLFAKLNAMDLKFFMNPSTYQKVVQLKKSKFNIKSDSNNSLNETFQSLFQKSIENKQVIQKEVNLHKQNVKKADTHSKTCSIDERGDDFQDMVFIKGSVGQQIDNLKNENIVTVFPELKRESLEREELENNSDFSSNSDSIVKTESETDTIPVEPELDSLNIELPQSAVNSVLIDCVKRNQRLLSDINRPLEDLWIKVSANMRDFRCPEKYCSANYCREHFNNLISQMVAVLQFAETVEEARNMFTLFDELSSIDLNRLLNKKINDQILSFKQQKQQKVSVSELNNQNLSID